MFMTTLLTMAEMWEKPKCLLIDEQINKMWHIHAMEYYSAIQRKETLIYGTTQMKLEDIMLSEISLSKKGKYYMVPLI